MEATENTHTLRDHDFLGTTITSTNGSSLGTSLYTVITLGDDHTLRRLSGVAITISTSVGDIL
jgi:hypothetical protein